MTTVETRLGPVTGSEQNGAFVALGVPYAAPPVGELRWMPPQSADPWPAGLDAAHYPNRCFQPPDPEAYGDRDHEVNDQTPRDESEMRHLTERNVAILQQA